MRRQKMPMTLSLDATATTTSLEILSDPVASNHIMCVQRLAFNDTGHAATLAIYRKRSGSLLFELSETVTLAVNTWYTDLTPAFFTEGEQISVYFVGVTVGDLCRVHAFGYTVAGGESDQPEGD